MDLVVITVRLSALFMDAAGTCGHMSVLRLGRHPVAMVPIAWP